MNFIFAEDDIEVSTASGGDMPQGSETILVVEDEEALLDMIQDVLEQQGYTILTATNGLEAMERLEAHSGAVDLVLTDVRMPEMDGRALAAQARAQYPDLRIVFMSAYTEHIEQLLETYDATFIPKPFSIDALAQKIRALLDAGA